MNTKVNLCRLCVCLILGGAPSALQQLCAALLQFLGAPVEKNPKHLPSGQAQSPQRGKNNLQ